MSARRRVWALAALFALLLSVSLVASSPLATVDAELLSNGDFEDGFTYQDGCGMVGNGWQCFTNGGAAAYGFYDEMWAPVVWDGEHSQLIEINTKEIGGDPDRYAGIFQTVDVIVGETYDFAIRGLLRADDGGSDPWRYRVQVGFDHRGGNDWTAVTDWTELPWDDYYSRTSPGSFDEYSTQVKAQGHKLTVFVRVWKKWGDWYRELDVNLDGISLVGAAPVVCFEPCVEPCEVEKPKPEPKPEPEITCAGPNLLANGNFEGGFMNGVGKGWSNFDNGGAATYGFYDDMWDPVVAGGEHSQLIEINTYCRGASDPDRYAGIYQTVCGLWPGATYELSLYGMMRQGERGWDGDPYRYRVQWGYTTDGSSDWTKVSNWQEIPWDDIYPRTAPGAMAPFSVRFAAPSSKITLFFRAWKKWGNSYEELDVNLDEISLRECGPEPPEEVCVDKTTGARLSYQEALQIAQDSECLEQGQLKETHFCNENTGTWWIDLDIVEPGCAPACVINVNDNTAEINWRCTGLLWPCWTHVVQRGDTLSGIAAAYGSTVAQIVADNGIVNPHVIYVGQELWVCDP